MMKKIVNERYDSMTTSPLLFCPPEIPLGWKKFILCVFFHVLSTKTLAANGNFILSLTGYEN
jgi:hypothetical protein